MDYEHLVVNGEVVQSLCCDRIANAISELFMAWQYANTSNRDIWDFAVEVDLLRSLGANRTDFRFLMSQGFVRHGIEVKARSPRRHFRESDEMVFRQTSAFVLTEAGHDFASDFVSKDSCEHRLSDDLPENVCNCRARTKVSVIPVWDVDRHELTIGGELVKRFKWRATNQELILATFQEECWSARIDDPLPPRPNQDPKRRLHDTIKCLNRKQVNKLVKFHGDGTGKGVLWEHPNR